MAMGATSPLRWLIGSELARYRNDARLTLVEASERTGISKPKLGHLETGRQQQDPDDIATLLAAYGAQQRDIDRLTSLTGRADDAMWWAPWAQVVPDWLTTLAGLEGLAERKFTFEPTLIPGILQTPEYAAAVTDDAMWVRIDHAASFVDFRVARARRLIDPTRPLVLNAVLTEAALLLAVGSAVTRKGQFRHLLDMAHRPTVTIQVLRLADGMHSGTSGPFSLMDFAEVDPICYCELYDGAVYLREPGRIRTYSMVADRLRRSALTPDQSVVLIESMLSQ